MPLLGATAAATRSIDPTASPQSNGRDALQFQSTPNPQSPLGATAGSIRLQLAPAQALRQPLSSLQQPPRHTPRAASGQRAGEEPPSLVATNGPKAVGYRRRLLGSSPATDRRGQSTHRGQTKPWNERDENPWKGKGRGLGVRDTHRPPTAVRDEGRLLHVCGEECAKHRVSISSAMRQAGLFGLALCTLARCCCGRSNRRMHWFDRLENSISLNFLSNVSKKIHRQPKQRTRFLPLVGYAPAQQQHDSRATWSSPSPASSRHRRPTRSSRGRRMPRWLWPQPTPLLHPCWHRRRCRLRRPSRRAARRGRWGTGRGRRTFARCATRYGGRIVTLVRNPLTSQCSPSTGQSV